MSWNLDAPRRMFADFCALLGAVYRDMSPMVRVDETPDNFLSMSDAMAKYGDYSRTTPIIRRITGAW